MKKILYIVSILIVVLIGWFVLSSTIKKGPTARINNRTFNLYIAKSDKDRQIGLSKYNKIADNWGMVFQFGKADYYPFWMKEMKFPIDIIYVKDGKIVTIHQNVNPPQENQGLTIYNPESPADTVIEVNAGLSKKYNLKTGDRVSLSI